MFVRIKLVVLIGFWKKCKNFITILKKSWGNILDTLQKSLLKFSENYGQISKNVGKIFMEDFKLMIGEILMEYWEYWEIKKFSWNFNSAPPPPNPHENRKYSFFRPQGSVNWRENLLHRGALYVLLNPQTNAFIIFIFFNNIGPKMGSILTLWRLLENKNLY